MFSYTGEKIIRKEAGREKQSSAETLNGSGKLTQVVVTGPKDSMTSAIQGRLSYIL